MEYYIMYNRKYCITFLLEVECFNAEDQAESGNVIIGKLNFSGRAKKVEELKAILERNGFDSQAFSSFTEQIATAVYKAAAQESS